jgi:hypothetical protein
MSMSYSRRSRFFFFENVTPYCAVHPLETGLPATLWDSAHGDASGCVDEKEFVFIAECLD